MRDLISRFSIFNADDIPQIIVIGSQTSGKSSVIEGIINRDFLPKGREKEMKVPVIIKLSKNNEMSNNEWGEFLHIPNKKFNNFNEIKEEIMTETKRITRTSNYKKGSLNIPIYLNLYSPDFINLTIIELPGLNTLALYSDSPPNNEKQIPNLILQYINNKNSLILAVVPSNTDIVTSYTLKLAKQVDILGTRTLGVLTKVDIMDKGTDCTDFIEGKVIPLNLGFVGVVSRSFNDIKNNKSLEVSLKEEHAYFQNDNVYKNIAYRMGYKCLRVNIKKFLLNRINEAAFRAKLCMSPTCDITFTFHQN
ncbi:hypothetical protein ABK040_005304 [Willaertia magna]